MSGILRLSHAGGGDEIVAEARLYAASEGIDEAFLLEGIGSQRLPGEHHPLPRYGRIQTERRVVEDVTLFHAMAREPGLSPARAHTDPRIFLRFFFGGTQAALPAAMSWPKHRK